MRISKDSGVPLLVGLGIASVYYLLAGRKAPTEEGSSGRTCQGPTETKSETSQEDRSTGKLKLSAERRSRLIAGLKGEAKRRWQEDVYDQGLFAPFSPTPVPLITRTLEVLGVNKSTVVYDVGCGDGRWLIEACARYDCKAVGLEIDSNLITIGQKLAGERGVGSKIDFQCIDVKDADLTPASVVVVYSGTEYCKELVLMFQQQLKPGTRVASIQFPLPGWTTDGEYEVDGFVAYTYTM